jgi:Arc/MetJ family transcription regulator
MTNIYTLHIIWANPGYTALIRQSGRTTIELTAVSLRTLVRDIGEAILSKEKDYKQKALRKLVRDAKKELIERQRRYKALPVRSFSRPEAPLVLVPAGDCEAN